MKVRIDYTLEVPDEHRRAINLHYGRPGLATRDEVKRWYESNGVGADDNLMREVEREDEECGNCLFSGNGPDPECPVCGGDDD